MHCSIYYDHVYRVQRAGIANEMLLHMCCSDLGRLEWHAPGMTSFIHLRSRDIYHIPGGSILMSATSQGPVGIAERR